MLYSDTLPRGTLRYRLLSNSMSKEQMDPGQWSHEYIRHLAAELGSDYAARQENLEGTIGTIEELRYLALECAKFLLHHHAELDAVDPLEETEVVDNIRDQYLLARVRLHGQIGVGFCSSCVFVQTAFCSCVPLLAPPDDISFLRTIHDVFVQYRKFLEAMAIAI